MTETSTPTTQTGTAPHKGVKQGLPATGLPAAEDAASKLWAVARLGTATPEAFAQQWGATRKPSGSSWTTRLAVLRGFGLLRFEDNKQIGLSDLAQQLVNPSNPAAQTSARRTALLNLKAYRELVDSFNGYEVPELTALATKLRFEYGKTEDFAKRAAQAFLDSLRHAAMLDAGNVVRKEGVSPTQLSTPLVGPAGDVETPATDDDEAKAAAIDRAFDEEEATDEDPDVGETPAGAVRPSDDAPPAANVSLALTLDLSSFRADEVVEILTALGFATRG